MGVDNVVYREQDGTKITKPFGTDCHRSRKAGIKTSVDPRGAVIRWRVLVMEMISWMLEPDLGIFRLQDVQVARALDKCKLLEL